MEHPNNPVKPDLYDVLATAIQLAAEELAQLYPQDESCGRDSVETWKRYLLQRALKKQEAMTDQERTIYREEVLT